MARARARRNGPIPAGSGSSSHTGFPALDIAVVNRGVNGDNDYDKRGRFQRDVVAEKPDIVLWQLGTNSMLHGNPLEKHIAVLRGGVDQLRKATSADIVLIDPQYAPKVMRGAGASSIIAMIAETARGSNVNLFRRYELMRRWREVEQLAFDKFISPDELHMNDWSYACVARALGTAIADAATRPVPTAQGGPRPARRARALIVEHDLVRFETGSHPGSSPGQAFSGSCPNP